LADSRYIFDYLNDVWDLLPEQDIVRFAETWKAYEQIYGYLWMNQFDSDLANTITRLPVYNTLRWLKHTFDSTTQVLRAATFLCNQDLSQGIDLSSRYLIKLSVDGGTPVEVDLRGPNPSVTTLAQIVAHVNQALGVTAAFAAQNNQLLQFTSPTKGPASSLTFYPASAPFQDASAIILGLDPVTDLPKTVPELPYEYQLYDKLVVGIPTLQTRIHDDAVDIVVLTQGVDYTVEFGTGVISFLTPPPEVMWAKDTFLNYETPYNNFGYLMGIYDTNTVDYLKAVKGLWFAFWNGPRPEYIRRSIYLLFGLPTASNAGTVTDVTSTQITVTYADTSTETFAIPSGLTALVTKGQAVEQFEPLVDGIRIYDKVNYPGFIRLQVGRAAVQPFLTQYASRGASPETDETKAMRLLEENTYLPQINVNAFISPNIKLSNVKTFLRSIEPRSRAYLFQVLVGTFSDPLLLNDEGYTNHTTVNWPNGRPALGFDIAFDATSNVDWNVNTAGDLDEWTDAETNPYTYLTLDENVLLMGDKAAVEVYQSAVLIDSFSVEG
jgi:hypothetical protein